MEKKNREIAVKCPTCKKSFSYFSSPFRPFCGEKCKLIDLGKWLDEDYSVPVGQQEEDNSAEETASHSYQ